MTVSVSRRVRVAVLCGGRSGEHEVSLRSARSVLEAIDPERFDVSLIGIDKNGAWRPIDPTGFRALTSTGMPSLPDSPIDPTTNPSGRVVAVPASELNLDEIDVVFPVLHGTFGEDGCTQGFLELADLAYVGAGVLGAAIGMDKDVQKRLLAEAGLPIVPYVVTTRARLERNREAEMARFASLSLPVFVKPANLGSSVGVVKVADWSALPAAIEEALQFDEKILVEQGVDAREIECAVLGNEWPEASIAGELDVHGDFYSYEAKYIDDNGATVLIPAPISVAEQERVRAMAVEVFQVLECAGMARVDFFLERGTGQFYVNEINTIPGFTSISMYPKLWEASGLSFRDLISRLIELAMERQQRKSALRRSFDV